MARLRRAFLLSLTVTVGLTLMLTAGSFGAPAQPPAMPRLVAVPVDEAPVLNGMTVEEIWNRAPAVRVKTESAGRWGAANKSETTVELRAVYTRDSVYFLVRYQDPTYSIDRQRWAFNGQAWALDDQTPEDRGGANTYYEDKMAFLWVINSASVLQKQTFYPSYVDQDDAAKAGYRRPVKAMPRGERLDMWHWKLIRTGFTKPAQFDDQYVDDTLDARAAANAGRKSDAQAPNNAGGYYDNTKQFTVAGRQVRGPRYFIPGKTDFFVITQEMIASGEAREIADTQQLMSFPVGAKFPGVIGRVLTGSRGDITSGHIWNAGAYTLELGRKLVTGDKDNDVAFDDLTKIYYFGVGTFDNTQIQHGVSDLIEFVFRR